MQSTRVQRLFFGVGVQNLPFFNYQSFTHYTVRGKHLLQILEQLYTFVAMKPNTPKDVILYFAAIATAAILTALIY